MKMSALSLNLTTLPDAEKAGRPLNSVEKRKGALAPRLFGEAVQDAVHDARLGAFEEGLADLHVLVDGDLERHVGALHQLEGARPQDGPEGRVQAFELPSARQA